MDIVSRELLLRGAEALERIVAETHINEINYIINQEAERIQQRSRDWGAWDDTLKFVEGRFPEYEKLYIDDKTFEDRKVDVIAYFDKAGKLKYARAYELDTGKWSEAPKDLETIVAARGLLAKNEKGGAKGIITVGGRLMAAGTWPILNSAGKGPLHGTVFMGRWFSPKSTKEIFGILPQVVTVQLMTLAEADSNPGAADALADMDGTPERASPIENSQHRSAADKDRDEKKKRRTESFAACKGRHEPRHIFRARRSRRKTGGGREDRHATRVLSAGTCDDCILPDIHNRGRRIIPCHGHCAAAEDCCAQSQADVRHDEGSGGQPGLVRERACARQG